MGALPRNIQPESRAATLPIRLCLIAPTLLKIAPWAMSVPTATVGLKPNRRTSSGVIRDPPPIPVMPTRVPISRPAIVSCQVIDPLPDEPLLHSYCTPFGVSRISGLGLERFLGGRKNPVERGGGWSCSVLRGRRKRLRKVRRSGCSTSSCPSCWFWSRPRGGPPPRRKPQRPVPVTSRRTPR